MAHTTYRVVLATAATDTQIRKLCSYYLQIEKFAGRNKYTATLNHATITENHDIHINDAYSKETALMLAMGRLPLNGRTVESVRKI